jgi:hypothetical protein
MPTLISHTLRTAGLAAVLTLPPAFAHDSGAPHTGHDVTTVTALPFITESKGPVSAPKPSGLPAGTPTTGQGFWTFIAARDKVPVPAEALPKVKGAHGTLVVDPATDTAYWGLQDIGWIAFTGKLSQSAIVPQDPAFKAGNLHGADLLPRRGKTPLIAAADNVQGEVYLSDTSFQQPETLKIPNLEPYADGKGYAPTDVAFEGATRVWVTDGYGKAWFMPASVNPLRFEGAAYGGKKFSGTPHGITFTTPVATRDVRLGTARGADQGVEPEGLPSPGHRRPASGQHGLRCRHLGRLRPRPLPRRRESFPRPRLHREPQEARRGRDPQTQGRPRLRGRPAYP